MDPGRHGGFRGTLSHVAERRPGDSEEAVSRYRLEGECNQCGLCCLDSFAGRATRCEHLLVMGNVGEPMATVCMVHAERRPGMTIRMVDRITGEPLALGLCQHTTPDEVTLIRERGIGKGCSLIAIEQYTPLVR